MPPKKKSTEKVVKPKKEKVVKPKKEKVVKPKKGKVAEQVVMENSDQDAESQSDDVIVQESEKLLSVAKSDTDSSSNNSVAKVTPIQPATQNIASSITTPIIQNNNESAIPNVPVIPNTSQSNSQQCKCTTKIDDQYDALSNGVKDIKKGIHALIMIVCACILSYVIKVVSLNVELNVDSIINFCNKYWYWTIIICIVLMYIICLL